MKLECNACSLPQPCTFVNTSIAGKRLDMICPLQKKADWQNAKKKG